MVSRVTLWKYEKSDAKMNAIKLMFLDVEIAANLLQASGSFWTTLGGTEVNLERSLAYGLPRHRIQGTVLPVVPRCQHSSEVASRKSKRRHVGA